MPKKEAKRGRGRPPLETPRKTMVSIRMELNTRKRLERLADMWNLSITDTVHHLVDAAWMRK